MRNMNRYGLMVCLAHVLIAHIKTTQAVPMPPDQSDIDLIVDSAYAVEQEHKDFEHYLKEIVEKQVSGSSTESTLDQGMTGKPREQDTTPNEREKTFEEYLNELSAQSESSTTAHPQTVFHSPDAEKLRELVNEIFPGSAQNDVASDTQINTCLTPYLIDNRTVLTELVETIVDYIFTKPAENRIVTETREEWIQKLVDELLAGAKTAREWSKSTAKRTISSKPVTQSLDDSKAIKIQQLADDIFTKLQGPTAVTWIRPSTATYPHPTTTPLPHNVGCELECEALSTYDYELLQLALSHARFEQRLLLTDAHMPPVSTMNSAELVRALISDVLQLPHLTPLLLQAQRAGEHSILFEMASAPASLEVIARARAFQARLPDRAPFRVEATDANFFDIAMHARIAN